MTEHPDDDPKCKTCGAPLTTTAMAAFCPRREKCEFWPEDARSQEFLDGLGWRRENVKRVGAAFTLY